MELQSLNGLGFPLTIRDRLVGQRTALMNQARAFCLEYELAMCVGAGGFHADIRRYLANAGNDLTPAMQVLLEEPLDDLAYTEGRIKDCRERPSERSSPWGSLQLMHSGLCSPMGLIYLAILSLAPRPRNVMIPILNSDGRDLCAI